MLGIKQVRSWLWVALVAVSYGGLIVMVGEKSSQAQVAISPSMTLPVADGTSIVQGSSDITKQLRFEVDGLTTATTRVVTWPDASGTAVIDNGIGFTPPSGAITAGRFLVTGFTPTAAAGSTPGVGASGTVVIQANSTDMVGKVVLTTAGAGIGDNGDVAVTFSTGSAYGTVGPVCIPSLEDGTGTWDVGSTIRVTSTSTTSASFHWQNASVTLGTNLTTAKTYAVVYYCYGR